MSPFQKTSGGYTVVIRPGHYTSGARCFIAEHPELPGCEAYADTAEDAEALLEEARALYLKSLADAGEPAPPATMGVSRITWFSGTPANGVPVASPTFEPANPELLTTTL